MTIIRNADLRKYITTANCPVSFALNSPKSDLKETASNPWTSPRLPPPPISPPAIGNLSFSCVFRGSSLLFLEPQSLITAWATSWVCWRSLLPILLVASQLGCLNVGSLGPSLHSGTTLEGWTSCWKPGYCPHCLAAEDAFIRFWLIRVASGSQNSRSGRWNQGRGWKGTPSCVSTLLPQHNTGWLCNLHPHMGGKGGLAFLQLASNWKLNITLLEEIEEKKGYGWTLSLPLKISELEAM